MGISERLLALLQSNPPDQVGKPEAFLPPPANMSTPPEWAQSLVKALASPVTDAGAYLGGVMGGQIPFHAGDAMQEGAKLASTFVGPKIGAGTIAAMAAPIAKAGTRLAPEAERVINALRPYQNAPDSLMGFARNGPPKGFDAEKYRHIQHVEIASDNGDTFIDAIKGLNQPHAIERAHRNWPGSKIRAISEEEARQLDPSMFPNYAMPPE